jgi:hypothetical protein
MSKVASFMVVVLKNRDQLRIPGAMAMRWPSGLRLRWRLIRYDQTALGEAMKESSAGYLNGEFELDDAPVSASLA